MKDSTLLLVKADLTLAACNTVLQGNETAYHSDCLTGRCGRQEGVAQPFRRLEYGQFWESQGEICHAIVYAIRLLLVFNNICVEKLWK